MKLGKFTNYFQIILYLISMACISTVRAELSSPNVTTDFTTVAKKAIPAVVSIKIKSNAKSKTNSPWREEDNSQGLFNDDFFQRFFGLPRKSQRENQDPYVGQASGFIVSSDGYVLTNDHVVKDAGEILVTTNEGKEYPGTVIGQDENTDIALIKIEGNNFPYLHLANSDDLEVGQWVVAIGNPLGLQASLTVGVVSAKGRNNLDLTRVEDFIQTDAAINHGNSGGPLLSLEGSVVGMNTAIVSNVSTGGYMGIGFAIPSNFLKHVLDELLSTGSIHRGFLGVTLQQVDSGLAQAFGLDKAEGALIAEVSKGSPADQAGLKQGDIIIKYNGQTVNNIASLRNAISLMKPGTKIQLNLLREGKMQNISLDVGAFPKESALVTAKENKYGFEVQNITPELAQSLGINENKGVIISKVDPRSPAGWAGLKKGIQILAVNQKKIESIQEFQDELDKMGKDKPLLLLVKQGSTVRFLSLQVH